MGIIDSGSVIVGTKVCNIRTKCRLAPFKTVLEKCHREDRALFGMIWLNWLNGVACLWPYNRERGGENSAGHREGVAESHSEQL
jgi:hypothetical protein